MCSPLHTLHQTGGGKQRLGLAARQVVEHRLGLAAQMLHTEVERRQNGNDLTKTQTHTHTHTDTHRHKNRHTKTHTDTKNRHTTTHIQKSGEKTEFATTYATRHGPMPTVTSWCTSAFLDINYLLYSIAKSKSR